MHVLYIAIYVALRVFLVLYNLYIYIYIHVYMANIALFFPLILPCKIVYIHIATVYISHLATYTDTVRLRR